MGGAGAMQGAGGGLRGAHRGSSSRRSSVGLPGLGPASAGTLYSSEAGLACGWVGGCGSVLWVHMCVLSVKRPFRTGACQCWDPLY